MLTALVAAVFMPLAMSPVVQGGLGPVVPAGANRSFQESVLAVEDALEKGDFDAAKRLFATLPKRKIRIQWDDSGAPESYRVSYSSVRDAALNEWKTIVADFGIEVVKERPDLVYRFSSDMPEALEGIPQAAAHAYSSDPTEPRLITVIGTKRGRPSQPATPTDVRNEVMFGMASYMGIERTHFPGSASFRSDLPLMGQTLVGQQEGLMVGRIFRVIDRLNEAIGKKEKLIAARPKLQIEPLRMDLPRVNQAEPVKFSIQVSNKGNAPLSFRFTPDCGCISPSYSPTLEPGMSALVIVNVDTVNFVGELRHKFFVFANDAEIPYREFPVSIDVDPLYKFVKPGPSVVQITDSGANVSVYLLLNESTTIGVRDFRLEGNNGTVTSEPWQGELNAPTGKVKGKGVKFNVKLARSPVPGRTTAALVVSTDSLSFPVIRTNIFAQRGILAMPEAVYFGEIPKAPSIASVLLSRPDLPFKVLKVESDNPFFKASVKPQPGGDEYRLVVEFDGRADHGTLSANITVFTDDPKQPKLVVPVMGSVK